MISFLACTQNWVAFKLIFHQENVYYTLFLFLIYVHLNEQPVLYFCLTWLIQKIEGSALPKLERYIMSDRLTHT